ncbi:MAG: alpha/beta hydrolase [Phycisphaerae bacterium]|nr:alpha/beta hydrolase [Phycisphaerae bacterium]
MIRKTLLWATVVHVFVLASAWAAEAPPIPPGYENELAVMTAIAMRQIKLIDAKDIVVPAGVEEKLGVEYGQGGSHPLLLDLYLPRGREKAGPAILFIHGGAWKSGKRSDMKYYCAKFAEKGYVTATVSYRLLQEAPFPAAVQDVKCAVRWLRANAAAYQVDPNRIAVSGNSAGGHLAMMIGYSDDPSLEGNGGHPGVSSRVRAVVDFYGPTDLTTDYARNHKLVTDFLGGKTFAEAPEVFKLASPLSHLTKDDPPTLIFQGTIDSLVPVAQADALASKLKELGIDYVYERYEGWPHTMDLAEAVNRRCVYQMAQFFTKQIESEE